MKIITQLTIQLGLWLVGMFVNLLIDGHVLVGGWLGILTGLLIVLPLHHGLQDK